MRTATDARAGRGQDRERGQMLALTAILLALVLLPVAAFVVDGGLLLMERRELANIADTAATSAAQQIDESVYRTSGGTVVVLNTGAARAAAAQRVAEAGVQLDRLTVTQDRVEVVVSKSVPLSFARVLGFDRMVVRAGSSAVPRYDARPGP